MKFRRIAAALAALLTLAGTSTYAVASATTAPAKVKVVKHVPTKNPKPKLNSNVAVSVSLYEGTPITATAATIYAVPANNQTVVNTVLAANTTGSSATITVELVPSGDSAATGYEFAAAVSVAANSTVSLLPLAGTQLVMNPGDELYAKQGTASAVNLIVSGAVCYYGGC